MDTTTFSPKRNVLVVAIGAAAYFVLLGFAYAWAPYSTIPQWWREHMTSGPLALVSWFALINVSGALLASLPVAIALTIKAQDRAARLGMGIGLVAGLTISIWGFVGYGVPADAISRVTAAVQFLAVAGATSVSVAIIGCLPISRRWGRR